MIRAILIFAIAFCFSFKVNATSYTWTGANNNDWNNSGNWSPGGIPGTGDDVTIGSGTCFVNTTSPSINMLDVSGGGGGTVIISGHLILNADLNTAGTITQTDGTIQGSGNLIVSGTFNWNSTSAQIQGTGNRFMNGVMNVTGGLLKTTLFNTGTINQTGNLVFGTNASLINTGTFNIMNNADLPYNDVNNNGIMNNGIIQRYQCFSQKQ